MFNDEEDKDHPSYDQPSLFDDGEEGWFSQEVGVDSRAPQGDCSAGSKDALGKVYFLETVDGKYVKIGFSTNIRRRMSQFGTLRPSHFRLRLIGSINGTMKTEQRIHRMFSDHRDNGEWFRSSSRLRKFMESLFLFSVRPEEASMLEPDVEDKLNIREQEALLIDTNKNLAAAALGRKGGMAPHTKPHGLASPTISTQRRREIAAMGVAARRRKGNI